MVNAQDPSIQFEIELPNENGFLSFVNSKITVNENGTVETKWYTKTANKGSHYQEQIKRAAIVNTVTTHEAACSTDTLHKEMVTRKKNTHENIERKGNNHKEKTQRRPTNHSPIPDWFELLCSKLHFFVYD